MNVSNVSAASAYQAPAPVKSKDNDGDTDGGAAEVSAPAVSADGKLNALA